MRCYYDVLGVKQDVSGEELRKAYRRLALQLHPDKNLQNEEDAKTRFQEIQGAYEVLSDPQERAFYDRNRENILHGEDIGNGPKEDDLVLYKYFRSSCYSGFDDSERGFYTVYRCVFESIASKDLRYLEEAFEHIIVIPNFGKSDTDLEDVAEFYGYWQSYCTSMSFYWHDKYDVRHAPNRWVEKRVERENKKAREKGKKEFNANVRELVAFVKKRDKRWHARKKQLEEKVAENARKRAEHQNQQKEERMKLVEKNIEEQKESLSQYERQLKEMESMFAEEWGCGSSDDAASDAEDLEDADDVDLMAQDLYCIACEKLFKSDNAFKNHETSRKHQERLSIISDLMKAEDEAFMSQKKVSADENTEEILTSSEEEVAASVSKKKKKRKQNKEKKFSEEINPKRNLSRKCKQSLDLNQFEKANDKPPPPPPHQYQNLTPEETLETDTPDCSERLTNKESHSQDVNDSESQTDVKLPKLKGKKAKEAKRKASIEDKVETNCSACGEKFNSRNKLFSHLKSTGHAAQRTTDSKSKNKVKKRINR